MIITTQYTLYIYTHWAQLKVPGLQRVAARQCVVCGAAADAYCAGCGITPYCDERCQRRDWAERHSAVCHNLARKQGVYARVSRDFSEIESKFESVAPLRRPHLNGQTNRREMERDEEVIAQPQKQFSGKSSTSSGKSERQNRSQDKRQPFKARDSNQEIDKSFELPKSTPKQESPQHTRNAMNFRTPRQPARQPAVVPEQKKIQVPEPLPQTELVPKTAPEPSLRTPEVCQEHVAPTKPAPVVKPATVSDVTPTRKLTPKHYLIEKLSTGDAVILSVEAKASDSRISRGDYVCLSMAEAYEAPYQSLCEDFVLDCDGDEQPHKLVPGETCSYFNPEDGGWYRARCLTPTTLALLDSGKIVTVTPTDKCRRLPNKYEAIPEFCCVLTSKAVEVGSNLSCKVGSQTAEGYKVTMTDVDTGADVGEGEVFRWLPTVEYQASPPLVPEVGRPPLRAGSRVLLVLAGCLRRVFVRAAGSAAQRAYNDTLQQVLLCAMNAKPLTEPPQRGQMVIAKFTDGNHYRALCRRTNVKQNKYQIEYIEYGNIEVTTLENLFPCPPEVDLSAMPAQVSMVKLADTADLSDAATEFIDKIKDEEELILTLPGGQETAPSGSDAILTMVKNKVNLNKKLAEMCMPEWKKIEERGGDVVETENIMYDSMEYSVLPRAGCTLQVLDVSVLRGGVLSGHDCADARAARVFGDLTDKMAEYCNSALGKDPYLPKPEELCIAQLPPYPQWFRAVFLEQVAGAGSGEARVCYLDYGNIASVPVAVLRKMMPDFITGYPVMGLHVDIRGFPTDATDEMLARAIEHMNIDEEGRGTLAVTNCEKQADGMYAVDAPALLKAMRG